MHIQMWYNQFSKSLYQFKIVVLLTEKLLKLQMAVKQCLGKEGALITVWKLLHMEWGWEYGPFRINKGWQELVFGRLQARPCSTLLFYHPYYTRNTVSSLIIRKNNDSSNDTRKVTFHRMSYVEWVCTRKLLIMTHIWHLNIYLKSNTYKVKTFNNQIFCHAVCFIIACTSNRLQIRAKY